MVRITRKISTLPANDPYLLLGAGILKRAILDTRHGDERALYFLETEFAHWIANAIGFEALLSRFCDQARLNFNPRKPSDPNQQL